MELLDALRSTASVREFTDESVHDETLFTILEHARFAPSGGNRQSWRVIVVRDAQQRRRLRDLYLDAWHDYVAHLLIGAVPFSPLMSEARRAEAKGRRSDALAASDPNGFPENLDRVPVMLVVCADLGALAATDRDLGRYQIVGGASVYPFVWNVLLAAREFDLGGVMTTVATRNEDLVRDVLGVPEHYALAAIVALGHPRKHVSRLNRMRVEDFTTVDRFDGPPFIVA